MVAKLDVMTAAEEIDKALTNFVHDRAEAKVFVEVNRLGHLHAVVATHAFEGMPQDQRDKLVWDDLRQSVRPEYLAYLYRVYALSAREYDARISRVVFDQGITEFLRLDSNGQGDNDE